MALTPKQASCRASRWLHSPSTTTTSLTTPHCAMFIELFLLEHLWCFLVTDDRQRRVFCGKRCPWQSCTAGGGRTSHAFTSISVSKGSFRWRLAWRVTDVCESTQHECENFPNWWLKTIIVLRIAACEGEHPDGSSVASKGSKGHPSALVQLRLRPSTFAVATGRLRLNLNPLNLVRWIDSWPFDKTWKPGWIDSTRVNRFNGQAMNLEWIFIMTPNRAKAVLEASPYFFLYGPGRLRRGQIQCRSIISRDFRRFSRTRFTRWIFCIF